MKVIKAENKMIIKDMMYKNKEYIISLNVNGKLEVLELYPYDPISVLLFSVQTLLDYRYFLEEDDPYIIYRRICYDVSYPIPKFDIYNTTFKEAFEIFKNLLYVPYGCHIGKIYTLCGSMKFKDKILEIQEKLTLKGNIVLIPCLNYKESKNTLSDNVYIKEVHKRKIGMADEVLIVNINGYIGDNTKEEIEFAKLLNKKITYLEQETKI